MTSLLAAPPETLIESLNALGGRGYVVTRGGQIEASDPALEPLAELLRNDERDYLGHEGIFLAVGPESGALFGAFVHRTNRGQGAGGLRHWPYASVEAFIRDGLRLAAGMTRKNALAGLWWGGGKGIICRHPDKDHKDPAYRAKVYAEYGDFVTSLRGVYITAEDAGTTPKDMRVVFSRTRHSTCVPADVGGSGNPSGPTARGVISAMEGCLDQLGLGTLEGKTIAMQGAGNVATFMMEGLVERKVAKIIATDINKERLAMLRDKFAGAPVELRDAEPGDLSIFDEACDIFAPNALGGVLNPDTIPRLKAKIICGAANNQLLDDERDMAALDERGITYVPDFLCNRMGIVNCANEQYGQVPDDPAIERHLGREWENSVFVITKRVLADAKSKGISTSLAANQLADELSLVPHPIWGHRGAQIIEGLIADNWTSGG
jgi:glutamate dehydrogenase/leucine dehydrogenase